MTETICNILLSIMIGILSTGLLIVSISFVIWCVGEFICCIRGCIAEFQCAKPTDRWQLFLDIITVVNLLGTVALISAYIYFQL